MKKVILSLLLVSMIFMRPVNAQEDINITDSRGLRQGEWIARYENGNIRYQGHFIDDKPVGELKRYHENGQLMAVMQYKHDNDTVDALLYHTNGFLSAKGSYTDRKKSGEWEFFSDYLNNTLLGREIYKDDIREGESIKYHWNGNIAERVFYTGGSRTGEWVQYYTDETLALKGHYSDGKLNGSFEAFNTDGSKMLKGRYKNDTRDGEWIFYTKTGEISNTIIYEMGVATNASELIQKETDMLDELEKRGGLIADPAKTGIQW